MSAASARTRAWIDGLRIDVVGTEELASLIEEHIRARRRLVLAYANPHTACVQRRDAELRAALDAADVVYCDSKGMQICCWLAGEPAPPHVTYFLWLNDLATRLARGGARLYLLGSTSDVVACAAATLQRRIPDLTIAGTHHGYFSDGESPAVVERINESGADMLIAGLGTPRQETWLQRHRDALAPPVLASGGAFLEWVAAPERHAPVWATRLALAWLWRLKDDPARLWRRYLVENPRFLGRVLRQRWGRERERLLRGPRRRPPGT